MGQAEVIALDKVRARQRQDTLRQKLHACFERWLDRLEERLPEARGTLLETTQAVGELRQSLTGSLTTTLLQHTHEAEYNRHHAACPQCERSVKTRGPASRTLETLVGPVQLQRPYFYCACCRLGFSPVDTALEVLAGHIQLDVQQAAAKVAAEVPYETAHTLFTDLTGVPVSTERLHTLTNRIAEGLGVLEVAPTAEEIASTVAALAQGRQRRPIMVLACDGAHVPTRPETARGRRRGRKRQRARRCRWTGHYREAKGMRGSLVEGERIVHLFSWHQVQDTPSLVKALQQVQQAGLIPEDTVRLCVIADGARWIWDHVAPLFPQAHHILDYYHCAQYLHAFAALYSSEGATFKGQEWVEATLARLYCGEVHPVLESLRRLRPTTPVAVTALTNLRTYLSEHRRHLNYRAKRRAGYPIGSGGIESANKFLCHVRLKRSGAWWYTTNSNQMLALRCAKYNGTFERVVARYQQRQLRAKK